MNQLVAIALGGATGAVVRFLMSSGLYQWLGREFPYGTLAVNVVGSFLIGLLTEVLFMQRVTIALEYRAAILVGFIGAFTTFSTFALETLYLLEQGSLNKAMLNIAVSVVTCLFAVWIGLLCGRSLFMYSDGMIQWSGGMIPYALMIVNVIGAFIIGVIAGLIMQKIELPIEYRVSIMVILVGAYLTLSGLYLILFLIENGYTLASHIKLMLSIFFANGFSCLLVIWLSLFMTKQL